MFAIKDLESVKNLGAILVIPSFSAAYISDGAMETIRDPILDWLRNHDSSAASTVGWAIWFLVVVAVVTAVLAVFDFGVVWLHVQLGDTYVMAWFGFACLTAGVFVLSFAMPGVPQSPLNPLWHLALLCYGFSLIHRASKPVP
jgi:phosphoglycerol transferase MdoB-like AlkP superfamily enzyme